MQTKYQKNIVGLRDIFVIVAVFGSLFGGFNPSANASPSQQEIEFFSNFCKQFETQVARKKCRKRVKYCLKKYSPKQCRKFLKKAKSQQVSSYDINSLTFKLREN